MRAKPFLTVLFFFSAIIASAQVISCSPTESFWVIENEGASYALLINGEAKQNSPTQIVHNATIINYEFITPDSKGSNDADANILINYMVKIAAENRIPGTTLESKMKKTPDGIPLTIISTPSTPGKEGKIIVATIIDGNLLSVNTNRPKEENMAQTAVLLEDIIRSAKKVTSKDNLCSK